MEKTEIRPLFQFMASWPKKSNFEGVKTFLGPKKFRGYPILGFLTLKSTKKMTFFIKNQNWTSISIHRILAQKIQLWGGQNIFGPQNMFDVLHFSIFDPWKYQKMICFHQKHQKICMLKYCQFCDVSDENKWYF